MYVLKCYGMIDDNKNFWLQFYLFSCFNYLNVLNGNLLLVAFNSPPPFDAAIIRTELEGASESAYLCQVNFYRRTLFEKKIFKGSCPDCPLEHASQI